MKPEHHQKLWSKEDDNYLQFHWGERALQSIAAHLKRTPRSIDQRAITLGLGRARQGTRSLSEVAVYTGFSEEKIMRTVKILGLNIAWAFSSTCAKRKIKIRAFTDEQVEALVEYMMEHERVFTNGPNNICTTRGLWGVGKKPAACVKCGKTDQPYHAKDKCFRCYRSKPKTYPKYVPSGNPRGGGKKITDQQVYDIRVKRYKGATYAALASEYGITAPAVSSITKGRFRKKVNGPIEPYKEEPAITYKQVKDA